MKNPIEVGQKPWHEGLGYVQEEVGECSKIIKSRKYSSMKFVKKELPQVEGVSYHDDDVDGKTSLKRDEHFKGRTK